MTVRIRGVLCLEPSHTLPGKTQLCLGISLLLSVFSWCFDLPFFLLYIQHYNWALWVCSTYVLSYYIFSYSEHSIGRWGVGLLFFSFLFPHSIHGCNASILFLPFSLIWWKYLCMCFWAWQGCLQLRYSLTSSKKYLTEPWLYSTLGFCSRLAVNVSGGYISTISRILRLFTTFDKLRVQTGWGMIGLWNGFVCGVRPGVVIAGPWKKEGRIGDWEGGRTERIGLLGWGIWLSCWCSNAVLGFFSFLFPCLRALIKVLHVCASLGFFALSVQNCLLSLLVISPSSVDNSFFFFLFFVVSDQCAILRPLWWDRPHRIPAFLQGKAAKVSWRIRPVPDKTSMGCA